MQLDEYFWEGEMCIYINRTRNVLSMAEKLDGESSALSPVAPDRISKTG